MPNRIFPVFKLFRLLKMWLQTQQFSSVGKGFYWGKDCKIYGGNYIKIGAGFHSGDRLRLEAHDSYANQNHTPCIIIGDNVSINDDCHIGAINLINIGNNVLIASKVYIADHSHGDTSPDSIIKAPQLRPLLSKGPVIIEENVWIGEGVAILPNVTIGRNSIIGANAVVTKNIPAFSVVVGAPARVIKTIDVPVNPLSIEQ